jgi:hypothetical protein
MRFSFQMTFILTLLFSPTTGHADIFDIFGQKKYEYSAVESKIKELLDLVKSRSCPHLSGLDLKECLAGLDGYGMPYGARKEKQGLFLYRVFLDTVFGVEQRQVEEKGFAFQIQNNLAVVFVIETNAILKGDELVLGAPAFNSYLEEITPDGSLTGRRTMLTVKGKGWIDISYANGEPRPPRSKPGIHYEDAREGINELRLAVRTAF